MPLSGWVISPLYRTIAKAPAKAALNAESALDASPAAGFLVGGISSGANFAGVVAYQARDAGLSPPITGLFLSVPVALMPRAYGLVPPEWKEQLRSIEQNGSAPLLTERSLALIEGEPSRLLESVASRRSV